MMDSRNAHLDALPGKVYRDWFEQLNRASGVFIGNSIELEKHFTQFVGAQMFVGELPDDFSTEAARLLHNYLAAIAESGPNVTHQVPTTSAPSGRWRCGHQKLTKC